jgi:hypothetical protein
MERAAASSTASLDVTELANTSWAQRTWQVRTGTERQVALAEETMSSGEELAASTSLLLSDIIRLDGSLRSQSGFDAISFVIDQALTHTENYCREQSVQIRAFHSVEVLRFMLPDDGISFLFIFEAAFC